MKHTKSYLEIDEKIKNAYIEYLKKNKKMPTQETIGEMIGISRKTVNVHLNAINLYEIVKPFRVLSENVLSGLSNRAMKGDAQAAKLFFMLVHDWSEKHEHKVDGDVTIIFEDVDAKDTTNTDRNV